MTTLINILEKCNKAYSLGSVYEFTEEDIAVLLKYKLNYKVGFQVTDKVYDQLYSYIKKLDPDNDFFKKLTSINTGYGTDVDLPYPTGSLTECKPGEIEDWVKKYPQNSKFVLSNKLDGLSVVVVYKDGKLIQAITRGDGKVGKDITRHIYNKGFLPTLIQTDEDLLVIRGELICPKDNIAFMLDAFKEETGKSYKNGRNTVAGYLNSKETIKAGSKFLQLLCYDVMNKTWELSRKFTFLNQVGIKTPEYLIVDKKDITTQFLQDRFSLVKDTYNYECDGVVVTEDKEQNVEYETGTINPIFSRKYKTLPDMGAVETTIIDINWQVGKTKKLTPVLVIDPIEHSGAIVTNVSGFNYQQVKDNGWGIGAKVKVLRSGDVIPKIVETISPVYDIKLPQFEGINVIIKGVDLILEGETLEEVKIKQLYSFATQVGLDQCGEATIRTLCSHIPDFDIYKLLTLKAEDLELWLGKNGLKLYTSIQEVLNKKLTKAEFYGATGVFGPGISTKILELIESTVGLDTCQIKLDQVEGLGPVRSKQILEYYKNYIALQTKLTNIIFFKDNKKQSKFNVLFTGFRSDELKSKIEEVGGTVVDTMSKSVNLVVTKDINSTSNKIKYAQNHNIPICVPEEVLTFIKSEF